MDPDDEATDTLRELSDAKACLANAKFEMCPQLWSSGRSRLVFLGQTGHGKDTVFESEDPSVRFAASPDVMYNHIPYATTHMNLMGPQHVRDGNVVDVAWSSGGQRTVTVTRPSADPGSVRTVSRLYEEDTSLELAVVKPKRS